MTETKPTTDDQIASIKAAFPKGIPTDAVGVVVLQGKDAADILASLERLRQIEGAEMPVEPVFLTVLRHIKKDENIVNLIAAYDEVLAYAQRKEAELSDAVHLNDERAQRVFRAEAEAREHHERAVSDKQVIEAQWATAHNRAEKAERERDALLCQLPEGMKHCTIVFKECPVGHGWLTATNWVQHDCPICERDALRKDAERYRWLTSLWPHEITKLAHSFGEGPTSSDVHKAIDNAMDAGGGNENLL